MAQKLYSHLYNSQSPIDTTRTNFLNEFPLLSEEGRDHLDAPIQLIELSEALTKMKGGETAGPDGIPIDTYKTLKEKLLPSLLEKVNETFEKGCLPPTLQSALIIVILKPEKNPSRCESYRPISLQIQTVSKT